jgi:hypothetical protein
MQNWSNWRINVHNFHVRSLRLRTRSYLLRHINGTDVQLVNTIYATQVINYLKVILIKMTHTHSTAHTCETYTSISQDEF